MNKDDILITYVNGNVKITIFSSGIKMRDYEDIPKPYFPEIIELNIDDSCNLNKLKAVMISLPSGVEVVINNSSALDNPNLIEFLVWCKTKGIICYIVISYTYSKVMLETLLDEDLIKTTELFIIQDYLENNAPFSMYIDAVNQEYAPTSVSNDRKSFNDLSLYEYFINYKNLE